MKRIESDPAPQWSRADLALADAARPWGFGIRFFPHRSELMDIKAFGRKACLMVLSEER
jgi:hypothetical protein